MIEKLQNTAKELLEHEEVSMVIGYGEGSNPQRTTPIFITRPEDASRLVWNRFCVNNLSVYLAKEEMKGLGKIAVVAKGCDVKSIIGLIQEQQVKRDNTIIIGINCEGVGDPILSKCTICDVHTPKEYDFLMGEETTSHEMAMDRFADVAELEEKSPQERWDFWQEKFRRCIRCYACRAVCPLCYCQRCIVEKSQPQWIDGGSHERGNLAWNIIRAFHLAGRCIGCGECERACPMNIPLGLANKKMAKEIEERFGYVAGYDSHLEPPMASFKIEDPEEFIR